MTSSLPSLPSVLLAAALLYLGFHAVVWAAEWLLGRWL